jgi:hypothetical protein
VSSLAKLPNLKLLSITVITPTQAKQLEELYITEVLGAPEGNILALSQAVPQLEINR